jgi:hypothetical protein
MLHVFVVENKKIKEKDKVYNEILVNSSVQLIYHPNTRITKCQVGASGSHCNPNDSGDCGSKPTQANNSRDPILNIPFT